MGAQAALLQAICVSRSPRPLRTSSLLLLATATMGCNSGKCCKAKGVSEPKLAEPDVTEEPQKVEPVQDTDAPKEEDETVQEVDQNPYSGCGQKGGMFGFACCTGGDEIKKSEDANKSCGRGE